MLFGAFALVIYKAYLAAAIPTATIAQGGISSAERGIVERDIAITHVGAGTFSDPGLGACGFTSEDSDLVVALTPAEFGSGEFCGRRLTATFNGKSVTVTVVDRLLEPAPQFNLDFSPSAYEKLASLDDGIIFGVEWHFLAPGE